MYVVELRLQHYRNFFRIYLIPFRRFMVDICSARAQIQYLKSYTKFVNKSMLESLN